MASLCAAAEAKRSRYTRGSSSQRKTETFEPDVDALGSSEPRSPLPRSNPLASRLAHAPATTSPSWRRTRTPAAAPGLSSAADADAPRHERRPRELLEAHATGRRGWRRRRRRRLCSSPFGDGRTARPSAGNRRASRYDIRRCRQKTLPVRRRRAVSRRLCYPPPRARSSTCTPRSRPLLRSASGHTPLARPARGRSRSVAIRSARRDAPAAESDKRHRREAKHPVPSPRRVASPTQELYGIAAGLAVDPRAALGLGSGLPPPPDASNTFYIQGLLAKTEANKDLRQVGAFENAPACGSRRSRHPRRLRPYGEEEPVAAMDER